MCSLLQGKVMKHIEMLQVLENIHSLVQESEQKVKDASAPLNTDPWAYVRMAKEARGCFKDLYAYVETMREPLFDLVHCGKIDK